MLYHPIEGPLSPGGRVAHGLVGLGFLALGLLLGHTASGKAQKSVAAHRWPQAPCTILAADVTAHGPDVAPYRLQVLYRYENRGRPFVGSTFRKDFTGSADIAAVERLARAYPPGARRTCFVNPSDPAEAVLRRDDLVLAVGTLVFIGALFGVMSLWFLGPAIRGYARPWAGPTMAAACLAVGLAMLGGFVGGFARPWYRAARALRWTAVPCTVESATVRQHTVHGEAPMTLYWPDIVFTYRVGGRTYRANNFNFTDWETPWYYGKRAMLADFPPGLRTTCFVDPADPAEAVLTRDLKVSAGFALVPLALGLLCLAGFVGLLIPGRLGAGPVGRPPPRPGRQRMWTSLAGAVGAAVTNLILVSMGADLLRDWRVGRAEALEAFAVLVAAVLSLAADVGFLASLRRRPGGP